MSDPVAQWLALQRAKNTAEGIGDDNLLTPTPAAARPIWSPDNSVGTSQLHDTYAGMPSPDVSPVIGAYGAHPVTAAMRANALNIASMAAQFGPADMASIRAFHGSPYDFNAFDTSKIGTGEGAQAYGHGLYFAENEGVARGYRDQLAGKGRVLEWNGATVEPGAPFYNLVDQLSDKDWRLGQIVEHAGKYDPASAIAAYEPHTRNASDGPAWQAAMDKFKEGTGSAATGTMYEVSLNADPEHFLDWDKPLSEQPDAFAKLPGDVQERMQRFGQKSKIDWGDLGVGTNADDYATGQTLVKHLTDQFGDPAKTSAMLHAAGIPGIKYLDQGSRSSGQGTSNYVIFDPKTIEILRKYGIAGLIAGGGAAATGTSSQNQQ
jgi:hypothetical protein